MGAACVLAAHLNHLPSPPDSHSAGATSRVAQVSMAVRPRYHGSGLGSCTEQNNGERR